MSLHLPPVAFPVNIVYHSSSRWTQHGVKMAIKFYKGFEIVAAPLQDAETESWGVDIVVRERTDTGLINHHHHSPEETLNISIRDRCCLGGIIMW